MKICEVTLQNYRSIDEVSLKMDGNYIAISGKNNSGKSNVLRAIRALFLDDEGPSWVTGRVDFNYSTDFPKWKEKERGKAAMTVAITLKISKSQDTSVYRFLQEFLQVTQKIIADEVLVRIVQRTSDTRTVSDLTVFCDGVEIIDAFKASEISRRLRASNSFIFHNSIDFNSPFAFNSNSVYPLGGLTESEKGSLTVAQDKLTSQLKKLAERQQKEILDLIGRLEERYHVSLDVPRLGIENMAMRISLGEKTSTIPLDEWGSGTQNRTAILMRMLRAKKASEAEADSERIAPILILEEPESFLHPSAQAEFGRMLQDLAKEFGIQVITTTHSPYMLSLTNSDANILLARATDKSKLLGTYQIPASGDNWMEPFGKALGIDNSAFESWRNVLFKSADQILLVEGKTDVEYFQLLKDDRHGKNKFTFEGEIFPYDGTGFFSNTVLLKFLLSRFKQVFITFDLDKALEVERHLVSIGLKKHVDFLPIGLDKPGLRDMEGLLPNKVRATVYSENADLVAHAQSAEKDRSKARGKLKGHMLTEFTKSASDIENDFDSFYKLARSIEKAFKG